MIDAWLYEALNLARLKYNPKLALCCEFILPDVDLGIPGWETIGGIIDYAVTDLDIDVDAGIRIVIVI